MIMTMLVKVASSVFIFSIFLVAVSALCSHPCSRVNRGTFVDEQNTYTFSCYNTSILTVNGGEELRECYTRLGAFLVVRNGNRYRCVKHTLYDRTARIVFVYVTPYKTFLTEPSICDVCSGTFTSALFVAEGENYQKAKKRKQNSNKMQFTLLEYYTYIWLDKRKTRAKWE
ncbi:uncharacterized protein LOC127718684 [Mytilus californianus]|uniref:uncharacterized protein LOC127718684 n=1 Tax=Mytilus californianus TaxID=6549 RepID=UPI0022453033|nr:uncharacterized protein LOC127718684 [Mytilus californianus]